LSKYLALRLRHQPHEIGLKLDGNGWADVEELIDRAAGDGVEFTPQELADVVANNNKRRFEFDEAGTRIRARHGHSIDVDLALPPRRPPDMLFHGTVDRFLDAIQANGLLPMARDHVHLSADVQTARTVGGRRGRPVVLEVAAAEMAADGREFWLSTNGVWLTKAVPPRYLRMPPVK
jgi:putative RNA 2'-phosphotransferase